ncbi:MAG TPA: TIR domain-containing protein, partial [Planctomycetaceae bacterium]|nr:TIR domain-containing protein [Planctomycetaceae bacterium]
EADLREADLRQVDLRRAILVGAKLAGANLTGANLSGADMTRADLTGVTAPRLNLMEAQLTRATLRSADLRGASLRRARITHTDLQDADLSYANLTDTDLRHCYLSGCKLVHATLHRTMLWGTSLERATLGWTCLASVDLARVAGLETVQHAGPSTIGIDTFSISKGQLPPSFLRGCGVPEGLIANRDRLLQLTWKGLHALIVCNIEDEGFAERLADALQRRGIRCWRDVRAGDQSQVASDRPGWQAHDAIVLCVSKASLTSDWIDDFVDAVLQSEDELREQMRDDFRLLYPLNLDGYLFSGAWSHKAEKRIAAQVTADFTGWRRNAEKFDLELERLLEAFKAR